MILDKLPITFGSPNDPEHDPHRWDDPDKDGWVDRFKPSTPRRAALTGTIITLIVTGALYTAHLFPVTSMLIIGLLLSGYPISWYRGRKSAFDDIRELDWSLLFTGKIGSLRYGRGEGAGTGEVQADSYDEDGYVFEPGRDLDVRGNMDPVEIRDLFGDPSNVRSKMHRAGDTGDAPARDYLPAATTAKVETDTLGDFYVTLTDGLERNSRSPDVDREATFPSLLPREMVGDIASEYDVMADVQLPQIARKHAVQKKRSDELARPVKEQVRERLDIALDIMQSANVNREEAVQRAMQSGDADRPGAMPSDAVEQYDEQVSEEIDEQLNND